MYLKDRAIKCIYKVPNIIGLCISNCRKFALKMLLSTFSFLLNVNEKSIKSFLGKLNLKPFDIQCPRQ